MAPVPVHKGSFGESNVSPRRALGLSTDRLKLGTTETRSRDSVHHSNTSILWCIDLQCIAFCCHELQFLIDPKTSENPPPPSENKARQELTQARHEICSY